MAKAETVRKATGRSQDEWYKLLDEWGASGRPFKEIAAWLTGEHGVSRWWAQKLIVEYEQDRGVRNPGARSNGTFEVGASKTVSVPVEDAFAAFLDGRKRRGWLPESKLSVAGTDRPRSARFEWDGSSHVKVTFTEKGATKTSISVLHSRLSDGQEATEIKQMWRDALAALDVRLAA